MSMFGTPGTKRPADYGSGSPSSWTPDGMSGGDRKKKRKSRWAQENEIDKTIIPGMPTVIPTGLSGDQEKQYLLHLQIEEVSRRLRTGDLGISANPEERFGHVHNQLSFHAGQLNSNVITRL